MPSSGLIFEKEQLAPQIRALFEKVRVAYLTAIDDPKNHKARWHDIIATVRDLWDDKSPLASAVKDSLDEDTLFDEDARNPQSRDAERIYEGITTLRYKSITKDPFTKQFGEGVLEALMEKEEVLSIFIHWALRSDKKSRDDFTEGYPGLDMEYDDIPDFIIDHYGDGKDTKRVEAKVRAAKESLKESMDEKAWKDLLRLDIKKAEVHFLVPNKPMYRIFDIEDMKELQGFSGEYIVQEKYDGMRIQIHKIDGKVKIYSYNEKDITKKCPTQVKIMEKKHFGDCVLDAELLLFHKNEALHRADVVAHIFKDRESEDTELRAHVFDIMRHEERELTEEPLAERIKTLFQNYSQHSDEKLAFPSKKDTRHADSLEEIASYAKEIMEIPTAEGVVIKDITSTYYIGTRKNPKWVKWKKFVDLDLLVLEKKSTKSNMFSYTLGAGPISAELARKTPHKEVNDRLYMDVGKALNTNIDVEAGDIIRVKVDEVNQKGDRFVVYSAKVIEVPEVELPDKVVTLQFLAKDTKKSLKYKVKALEKGISISDNIHGEAMILAKSDLDGFTIFGFENYNLMAKNALVNLDEWKSEIETIYKEKKGYFRVSIKNRLIETGPQSLEQILDFIGKSEKLSKLFNQIFQGEAKRLSDYLKNQADDILLSNGKFTADDTVLEKYETPEEYRVGQFKLYSRKDENLDLSIKLQDKIMVWRIELDSIDDVFNLFGKSKKFPAKVESNIDKAKLLDDGEITLGVQRHGYHEYFLEGNKFQSKLHFRVVPVKGKEEWVAFTSVKQGAVDPKTDEGVWDIHADKYHKL